jgi:hypothetical protein
MSSDQERSLDQRVFPDVILKSQFFRLIGRRPFTSEQRLMLAVLADAINIVRGGYLSGSEHKGTSFAEAKDWIFESECRCPLAFEHVCGASDCDRIRVRRELSAPLP